MRLRGRKGIREEIEIQKNLVILNSVEFKNQWYDVFGNPQPIHVELGMGKGRFISEMSLKNPQYNYIGIDMYDELIRKASEKARLIHSVEGDDAFIPNLRLVLLNIENIGEVFGQHEIDRIYLNFSDPWPKNRHASRRLTHFHFLEKYREVLKTRGQIHLKTDSRELFEFSLNSFSDFGFNLKNISFNLHAESAEEQPILTEYEMKFIAQNLPIYRCEAHL